MRIDPRGLALLVAVLLGLGLVVVGARADLTEFGIIEREAILDGPDEEEQQEGEEADEPAQVEDNVFPGWWLTALLIIYVVAAAVGVGFFAWMAWQGRPLFRRPDQGEVSPEDVDAEIHRDMVSAVDTGLREIEEGPPRDAVIVCWVRLEQAAARAGIARAPTETSEELTARLLASHRVTPQTLRRLAAVYREARYSAHVLDEDVRHEAREALARVSVELDRRRADATVEEGP